MQCKLEHIYALVGGAVCEDGNVRISWTGHKTDFTLPAPYYKVESCNKLSPCVKMSGHCWGIESDGVGV